MFAIEEDKRRRDAAISMSYHYFITACMYQRMHVPCSSPRARASMYHVVDS